MTFKQIKVGVTGSIGMGKTTVAKEIAKYNFPMWNADTAVHTLYKKGNEGYEEIKKRLPSAVGRTRIKRSVLSSLVLNNKSLLADIENIIHPLLKADRLNFINNNKIKYTKTRLFNLFKRNIKDLSEIRMLRGFLSAIRKKNL